MERNSASAENASKEKASQTNKRNGKIDGYAEKSRSSISSCLLRELAYLGQVSISFIAYCALFPITHTSSRFCTCLLFLFLRL